MDAKELRQKTVQEVTRLVAELRVELHDAAFNVASHHTTKVRELRRLKRDLARALTVLTELNHSHV